MFQDFLNNNKQFIYKAGLAPNPYISIATPAMQDVLAQAVNPFVTDSVEAVIQPTFYQGRWQVTMTSTWCRVRHTQVAVLVTLLPSKTTKDYKTHWKLFFELYGKHRTVLRDPEHPMNAFHDGFPGNTSDFSLGILAGFMEALDDYCLRHFNTTLAQDEKEAIYGFCSVHFKRGLTRTANVGRGST